MLNVSSPRETEVQDGEATSLTTENAKETIGISVLDLCALCVLSGWACVLVSRELVARTGS